MAFCLIAASPAPTATHIADILANPTSFDQLTEKTSCRGNDYTTFDLCDPTCIHAYSHGHPKIANGQTLTVNGTFFAVKKVGSLEFKNEINADDGSL